MGRSIWQWMRREVNIWRVGALPGLVVIMLIMLARLTGQLQYAERVVLDYLLRSRPAEPTDERILIVGIDEADIRAIGTYPVPDQTLAELLQALQRYEPAAIGLDIFRDLPVDPGHTHFATILKQTPNLIGIEKVLPDQHGLTIHPPPMLPPEQVGFVDSVLDPDGALRRNLLGTSDSEGNYRFSLTIRLAEQYLSRQGKSLENGIRDPEAMRFGTTELPRFQPHTGSYVGEDAGGTQVLINFRSGPHPFRSVSLQDVVAGNVPEDWIRNRIVLIGVVAFSVGDTFNVAAIKSSNPGSTFGIEVQAHTVSQIVSAVLDQRPLLHSWAEGWEYLWIVVWGVLGISLGRLITSPVKLLLGLIVMGIALVMACYAALLTGWWIPLVPALLALMINGAGLTASLFYQQEQNLRARLQERQLVIEQTFDTIHNGPLQTLAKMLRDAQERGLSTDPLYQDLEHLNQELRAVYESIRRETLSQGGSFHLSSDLKLDLESPTHEILYEVYNYTLGREFPCFKTLKLKLTTFENIDSRSLSLEQRRGLCRFLEEALCNVGKHAIDVTQITVVCKQEQGQNVIRVIDNGSISIPVLETDFDPLNWSSGRGTQQANALARQLGGTFRRRPNTPQGTICELAWSITKPRFWHF